MTILLLSRIFATKLEKNQISGVIPKKDKRASQNEKQNHHFLVDIPSFPVLFAYMAD
jgi:hypothetical protein